MRKKNNEKKMRRMSKKQAKNTPWAKSRPRKRHFLAFFSCFCSNAWDTVKLKKYGAILQTPRQSTDSITWYTFQSHKPLIFRAQSLLDKTRKNIKSRLFIVRGVFLFSRVERESEGGASRCLRFLFCFSESINRAERKEKWEKTV